MVLDWVVRSVDPYKQGLLERSVQLVPKKPNPGIHNNSVSRRFVERTMNMTNEDASGLAGFLLGGFIVGMVWLGFSFMDIVTAPKEPEWPRCGYTVASGMDFPGTKVRMRLDPTRKFIVSDAYKQLEVCHLIVYDAEGNKSKYPSSILEFDT